MKFKTGDHVYVQFNMDELTVERTTGMYVYRKVIFIPNEMIDYTKNNVYTIIESSVVDDCVCEPINVYRLKEFPVRLWFPEGVLYHIDSITDFEDTVEMENFISSLVKKGN